MKTELEKIYNLIEGLEKRVAAMEMLEINKDVELLTKKVDYVESFLNNRTRGLYERSKHR
ncbi:hypothetical protein [Clostridium sp. Cult2]|uniref:hypothetical protein n=1 Tax=Clostridium sp. Cult2 TaxID=2079003 RepID=UPI001F462FC6|nr:hypothetical protein [Clostridium sp. Cult2]MCF6465709.1 hypothetical protein [Clostridium sp. Cult2]